MFTQDDIMVIDPSLNLYTKMIQRNIPKEEIMMGLQTMDTLDSAQLRNILEGCDSEDSEDGGEIGVGISSEATIF